jgi:hypothetical protein
MEVTSQPTSLFLACLHELLAGTLQGHGETKPVDKGRGMVGDILEQPAVVGVQGLFRGATSNNHSPYDFPLVAQGHHFDLIPHRAGQRTTFP